MPAPGDRTPFELVDEGHGRYGSYRGRDRRRIHPRVSVSDRLTEARRGAWSAVAVPSRDQKLRRAPLVLSHNEYDM